MSRAIMLGINKEITEAQKKYKYYFHRLSLYGEIDDIDKYFKMIETRAYLAGLCKAMEHACKTASYEILEENEHSKERLQKIIKGGE